MTFISAVAQNRRKSGKYILPLIILFILQQKLSSVNPIWRCNGEKRRFRRFLYFLCLKGTELRSAGKDESKTSYRNKPFCIIV